jgi:hypothetical protein
VVLLEVMDLQVQVVQMVLMVILLYGDSLQAQIQAQTQVVVILD